MLKSGRSVSLHITQKILGLCARADGEGRVPWPKISRVLGNYGVFYTLLITESPAVSHASEIALIKLFLVLGADRKTSVGKLPFLTKEFLPRNLLI